MTHGRTISPQLQAAQVESGIAAQAAYASHCAEHGVRFGY